MKQPNIRKLYSNEEIQAAFDFAGERDGVPNYSGAAEYLTNLGRAEAVSRQLVRYWYKQINTVRKNGTPYLGTSVVDRKIAETRELNKPSPSDYLRKQAVQRDSRRILVIPDQHAPYHHPDALEFLTDVAALLEPTAVVNLGDETDHHALSFHDSDPNLDAAGPELEKAKVFIQQLAAEFPIMDVCHSNHGSMVYRKAMKHGVPTEYIRPYRDVLFPEGGGDGWEWRDRFIYELPNGDLALFQHQSSGDILNNAAHERCNIIQGHEHGIFRIDYRSSSTALYWAMISGCLIDKDSMAYAYGKLFPKKPIIGCSAIINSQPVLLPMPQRDGGRYTGDTSGILRLLEKML